MGTITKEQEQVHVAIAGPEEQPGEKITIRRVLGNVASGGIPSLREAGVIRASEAQTAEQLSLGEISPDGVDVSEDMARRATALSETNERY